MDERVAAYLDTMKSVSAQAMAFTEGYSKEEFLGDDKTQFAVVMAFIRIGECAARIERQSPSFIATRPEWPWGEIRAMRNRAAHGYEDLNFELIWETLQTSVPLLHALIASLGPLNPGADDPSSNSD